MEATIFITLVMNICYNLIIFHFIVVVFFIYDIIVVRNCYIYIYIYIYIYCSLE